MLGREGGHFIRQAMRIPQNHATWFDYDESYRFPTGKIDEYWKKLGGCGGQKIFMQCSFAVYRPA